MERGVHAIQMTRMPVEAALPKIQHPDPGGVVDGKPGERVDPQAEGIRPADRLEQPAVHRRECAGNLRRLRGPGAPQASAAASSDSPASPAPIGIGLPRVIAFLVRVPVLSEHSTSMPAISSIATRR